MHKNPKVRSIRIGSLLFLAVALALALGVAEAQPVAALPEFSHVGEQLMLSAGKSRADLESEIPSAESVGIPAYPGALYTGSIEGNEKLLSVVLASSDSIEKVKTWYSGQPGLTWSDESGLFFRGEEYVIMQSESVYLQDISADPGATPGGMFFNMNGMQTQITISYHPESGEKNE